MKICLLVFLDFRKQTAVSLLIINNKINKLTAVPRKTYVIIHLNQKLIYIYYLFNFKFININLILNFEYNNLLLFN